jgi:alpha-tubulin suppressor-like RCC1 family protein
MTASPSPVLVAGLSAVEQVVVGQSASCARLTDGTARCWGLNNFGQLGDGTMTTRATPVTPAVTDVVEIAMGGFTACARRGDGSVWCWGARESAGMGVVGPAVLTPTAVPGLSAVTRIYGGRGGFCALRGSDADLVCWGLASGTGVLGISPTPEAVRW